jgi:hypothetical protein
MPMRAAGTQLLIEIGRAPLGGVAADEGMENVITASYTSEATYGCRVDRGR